MAFKWLMIGVYMLLAAAVIGLPPHSLFDYVLAVFYTIIAGFMYFQIWQETRSVPMRGGRIDDTVIGSSHDD